MAGQEKGDVPQMYLMGSSKIMRSSMRLMQLEAYCKSRRLMQSRALVGPPQPEEMGLQAKIMQRHVDVVMATVTQQKK